MIVVITGAGGNFCSGGDVHEIIAPLGHARSAGIRPHDRRPDQGHAHLPLRPSSPQWTGICAGAIVSMASDLHYGTARSKVAFLFVRVGLAGADMGACNILPRINGSGRASELLFTWTNDVIEAERWGYYKKVCEPDSLLAEAQAQAICMQTRDFERTYKAFVAKQKPVFAGD